MLVVTNRLHPKISSPHQYIRYADGGATVQENLVQLCS